MTTFLVVMHIIVCLFLIAVVLLQSGKGAEMGAAFGGSSQTLFGSRGAATFLSKLTTISAVVFMLTSFALAIVASKGSSVIQKVPVAEEKATLPVQQGPVQGSGVQPAHQDSQAPAPQPQTE